jgi:hypothetical protein
MNRAYAVLISTIILLSVSCTYKPDLSKDYQMSLDGSLYVWEPGVAVGYVHGLEVGNPEQIKEVEILYPQLRDTQRPLPGLQLMFDPRACQPGKTVSFGRNKTGGEISFRPPYRPSASEGMVLGYSTREGEGSGEIMINSMDIRANGAISGKIVHARLYVYYYNQETGEVTKAQKPSVLEIWNFPFDVRLDVAKY